MKRLLLLSAALLSGCFAHPRAADPILRSTRAPSELAVCAAQEIARLGYLLEETGEVHVVRGEKDLLNSYPRAIARLTAVAGTDDRGRAWLRVSPARYEERVEGSGTPPTRRPGVRDLLNPPGAGTSDRPGHTPEQVRRRTGWRRVSAGPVAEDARTVRLLCTRGEGGRQGEGPRSILHTLEAR